MAFEQPGDAVGDADLGGAGQLAELPCRKVGVGARVEVGGAAEVMLGLGRVGDLAADPREAEHAQRLALVGVSEQIELPAAEEQVVGVDGAQPDLAALHREVLEGDRLVAEDRRLDLRQRLRELVAAGGGRDAEGDAVLVGRRQWAGPPPGDLLERQAQRFGVGELAVEQRQRSGERGQFGIGELDRREVEVLRAQRVVLLLGDAVDRLLDGQRDAQRLELRAVRVEASRKRVLVHATVALDVPLDVERGDRAALGHQIGDQGELADQLLGVLGHPAKNHRRRVRRGGARAPYLRAFARAARLRRLAPGRSLPLLSPAR